MSSLAYNYGVRDFSRLIAQAIQLEQLNEIFNLKVADFNFKQAKIFNQLSRYLEDHNLRIQSKDDKRPWGGFFVINEELANEFIAHFFKDIDPKVLNNSGKLSPKLLVVKPNSRLSWQYHNRRSEVWRVFKGSVGIVRSNTDVEGEMEVYHKGDQIVLEQGERHRLVGLDNFAVVAEIWVHTDPANPSNEEDIIRVQDDFGR